MTFRTQKRLSAELLGVGENRVVFDSEKLDEIKEAITREDIRLLINSGAIFKKPVKSTSRGRFRKRLIQKRKGRRKGMGRRKGTYNARNSKKNVWMSKVRTQRRFLKDLRAKSVISKEQFKEFYGKIKGNFFRSKSHLRLYLEKIGVKMK